MVQSEKVKTRGRALWYVCAGLGVFVVLVIAIGVAGTEPEPPCEDLQCLGNKHVLAAGVWCQEPVESLAKYDHKWIDGALEPKFSRFQWRKKSEGIIRYRGDQIQFQNGRGSWIRHTYWCDFDVDTDNALDVGASPGRLQ